MAISIKLNGSRGNGTVSDTEVDSRLGYHHGAHTQLGVLNYAYGKSMGVRSNNRLLAHLRYQYAFTERWVGELFAQIEKDELALLNLRSIGGAGLRVVEHGETWHIATGLGTFFEREEQHPATLAPVIRRWRGNAYLSLRWQPLEAASFQDTVYFQPVLKDTRNYRLLNSANLEFALTDSLSFTTSVEVTSDSRPPFGVLRTDVNYQSGIKLTF